MISTRFFSDSHVIHPLIIKPDVIGCEIPNRFVSSWEKRIDLNGGFFSTQCLISGGQEMVVESSRIYFMGMSCRKSHRNVCLGCLWMFNRLADGTFGFNQWILNPWILAILFVKIIFKRPYAIVIHIWIYLEY